MRIFDFEQKREIEVSQYNQKSLSFLYQTAVGRFLLKGITKPWISKIYGKYNDSKFSKRKINSFIKTYKIKLEDYEKQEYLSFNDFFTRKIKPDKRSISIKSSDFISVCDSRLTVYPIDKNLIFSVKQSKYSVPSILNDENLAQRYQDGLCLVFRLCVDDYHRYSFFDSGSVKNTYFIPGRFHTVSPIVYEHYQVFQENSRQVSVLETDHFGNVTWVEVGALMVGKIINHPMEKFQRGMEKGYFEFGGSTIVLFIEKDQVEIDPLILKYSSEGIEVKVQLGTVIGKKIKSVRKKLKNSKEKKIS